MSAYLNTGMNPVCCAGAQNMKGQLKTQLPDLEEKLMAQTQQKTWQIAFPIAPLSM